MSHRTRGQYEQTFQRVFKFDAHKIDSSHPSNPTATANGDTLNFNHSSKHLSDTASTYPWNSRHNRQRVNRSLALSAMESFEKTDKSAALEFGGKASGDCPMTGGAENPKLEKQLQIRDEHIPNSHQNPTTSSEWEQTETCLYSDLQPSDEFRLLYLQPGLRDEMIKCILKRTKFSEETAYEALSYEWGPDHVTQPIVINECTVYVRQNLCSAMQHLRSDTEVRVLWIDATCINQSNIHERNHQVTQMGMIYHRATRVIIWLGVSDADSKLAFEILSSTTKWTEYVSRPTTRPTTKPTTRPTTDNPAKRLEREDQLKAFSSFLGRDYWTRLWIIQEFVMARDFVLMCGNDSCSAFRFSWFMELLDGVNFIRHTTTKIDEIITNVINQSVPARLCRLRMAPGKLDSTRKSKRSFGEAGSGFAPQNLFGLFSEYKNSKCADQRDSVFGLHSLAGVCCKNSVPVDYSLTWEVILRELISHQLTSHNSLPQSVKLDPDTVLMYREFFNKAILLFDKSRNNDARLSLNELESLSRSSLNELESLSRSFTSWERKGNGLIKIFENVRTRAYARGRVYYTSPRFIHLNLSEESLIIPELTPMTKLQINYICRLNGNRESCHPYATTETDLVTLPLAPIRALPSTRPTIKSLAQSRINYWGCNMQNHDKDGDKNLSLGNDFHQLLYNAQTSFSGSNFILAFEENGLIFLASEETKVGDLLCQFIGSDVLAVIPAAIGEFDEPWAESGVTVLGGSPNNMHNVRRAVNFLASPQDMAADICGKPMSFDKANPYAIIYESDPQSIERLCRVSKYPNGPHNIPESHLGWDSTSL